MNEQDWHLLEDRISGSITVDGVEVKPGDRVRLRPRMGGDVLDIALAGKICTVESIEQDYEGSFHVSVVVDDDPGRDIGMMRQPGHRFFFSADEIEPIEPASASDAQSTKIPRILVAGIGNIFLGDDGFGVEVLNRLLGRDMAKGVCAIDFGIRGFDLACALTGGADVAILVDACPRGGTPGDLYIIEPKDSAPECAGDQPTAADGHSLDPVNVIRLARAMGGSPKRILLLGCEPKTFGPEEGHIGLSEPVESAVEQAVSLLESMVDRIVRGEWSWEGEPAA